MFRHCFPCCTPDHWAAIIYMRGANAAVLLVTLNLCVTAGNERARAEEYPTETLVFGPQLPVVGPDGFTAEARKAMKRAQHEIKEGVQATMKTCNMLKKAREIQPDVVELKQAHIQLLLKVGDQEMKGSSKSDMKGYEEAQRKLGMLGKEVVDEDVDEDEEPKPPPPPSPKSPAKRRKATSSAALRAILNVRPKDTEGYVELGHALASEPRRTSAGLTKAHYLAIGTRADEAVDAWRSALKLEPGRLDALQALSQRLSQSVEGSDRKEALALAQRAIKLAPDAAMSLVALGLAKGGGRPADQQKLVDASSREEAIEALEGGLRRARRSKEERLPKHVEGVAHYGLGLLKLEDDREAEAVLLFARAVKLEPSNPLYRSGHEIMSQSEDDKVDETKDKEHESESPQPRRRRKRRKQPVAVQGGHPKGSSKRSKTVAKTEL